MEPDDDIEDVMEDLEDKADDDFASGDVECDWCDQPGVVSTPDGDWLCEDHYEDWQIAGNDPWWQDVQDEDYYL